MKKILLTLTLTVVLFFSVVNEGSASSSTYTIKKGDSLYKVAKMHDVTVSDLKLWNNLKSDVIHPKQKLKLTSEEPKAKKAAVETPSRSDSNKVAKEFTVSATAYTANCNGCSGITKTGINLKQNPDMKVISVDPTVIKLGTKVHVEGYGYAIAGDTGNSIKGNQIDVFFSSKSDAYKWGRKDVKIKILE